MLYLVSVTKLLQKSEMRKNMVMDLIYTMALIALILNIEYGLKNIMKIFIGKL